MASITDFGGRTAQAFDVALSAFVSIGIKAIIAVRHAPETGTVSLGLGEVFARKARGCGH
jgi:hypothetical protein